MVVSALCALGFASAAFGQTPQPLQEDRQRTIDWFVNNYYYPREVCAFAGPVELTRLNNLLSTIRSENADAFRIAESSKEYANTIAVLQPKISARFRDQSMQIQATLECVHLTDQLVSAHKRRRHDDLFKLLLKSFAAPN